MLTALKYEAHAKGNNPDDGDDDSTDGVGSNIISSRQHGTGNASASASASAHTRSTASVRHTLTISAVGLFAGSAAI